MFRVSFTIALVGLSMLLSGCQAPQLNLTDPHIQQGSANTVQEAKQLKLGMSKLDVIALLGSPILNNPLNNNQWHYIYVEQKGHNTLKKHGVCLRFHKDRLVDISPL